MQALQRRVSQTEQVAQEVRSRLAALQATVQRLEQTQKAQASATTSAKLAQELRRTIDAVLKDVATLGTAQRDITLGVQWLTMADALRQIKVRIDSGRPFRARLNQATQDRPYLPDVWQDTVRTTQAWSTLDRFADTGVDSIIALRLALAAMPLYSTRSSRVTSVANPAVTPVALDRSSTGQSWWTTVWLRVCDTVGVIVDHGRDLWRKLWRWSGVQIQTDTPAAALAPAPSLRAQVLQLLQQARLQEAQALLADADVVQTDAVQAWLARAQNVAAVHDAWRILDQRWSAMGAAMPALALPAIATSR